MTPTIRNMIRRSHSGTGVYLMSARYYTTGNSRPHIVHDVYRSTPRVSGPITREKPLRYGIIAAPIALALVPLMLAMVFGQ